MAVLKIDKHDENREIEFEIEYLSSLTIRQRFEMMFIKTRELLSLLKKPNANRNTTEVIKRKPR